MIDFLHDKGYNYFNIPKLTFPEIQRLVNYRNKKLREQARQRRIAAAKRRTSRR